MSQPLNQPPPEEQEGTVERPEWLLEKFQSPEDQAKAFGEAEKRMTQLQTQLDQERNQFSEALQNMQEFAKPPEPEYKPENDPLINQYQQAIDSGDARAMLSIQLELNRISTEQAIEKSMKEIGGRFDKAGEVDREVAITLATERVSRGYENWEEMAPKIGAILQDRPHWIPQNASVEGFERALKEAAELVTAQEVVSRHQAEESSRQTKLAAQGLTGSTSRAPQSKDEQVAEWDRIKAIDLGGYSGIIGK